MERGKTSDSTINVHWMSPQCTSTSYKQPVGVGTTQKHSRIRWNIIEYTKTGNLRFCSLTTINLLYFCCFDFLSRRRRLCRTFLNLKLRWPSKEASVKVKASYTKSSCSTSAISIGLLFLCPKPVSKISLTGEESSWPTPPVILPKIKLYKIED